MTASSTPLSNLRVPLSAVSAGFIASLVGFASTLALIVQAAQHMGATPVQIISAVTALCVGKAVISIGLSYALRMPIVIAWSTAGAALVGASTLHIGYAATLGTYVAAGLFMMMLGVVPVLGRLAARIPMAVAAGMLAGVLLPFCLSLFRAFPTDGIIVGVVLVVFVLARQRFPVYAMLIVLAVVIALVLFRGDVTDFDTSTMLGTLSPLMPEFDWRAIISLGMPLFLVTLASQNLPGLAVLKAAGYEPPARTLLFTTGLGSALLAPFGSHFINLAAITAAICASDEAHPDKSQRWIAGAVYGSFYFIIGLFAAPVVALFTAMPRETIAAVTGIALAAPLTHALHTMISEPDDREAGVLTFVATASGVTILGIGSAFWGLVVGFIALGARKLLARRR